MELPMPGMKIDARRTALVITDLQNDFLSPGGIAWSLVAESLAENNTLENIEVLLNRHGMGLYDAYLAPVHGGSIIGFVTHQGKRRPTERLEQMRQAARGYLETYDDLDPHQERRHAAYSLCASRDCSRPASGESRCPRRSAPGGRPGSHGQRALARRFRCCCVAQRQHYLVGGGQEGL